LPTNSGKAKEPTKGNAANLIFHAAHSAGCKPKTVFMLLLLLVPLMPWLCCIIYKSLQHSWFLVY